MKARQFRYYDLLVHIFVVILLISNLVGQKITAIGPVRVGGAQLLFPLTYIFGDVFTEVYGYGASRRAIWIGFFASGLAFAHVRVHGLAAAGARVAQPGGLPHGLLPGAAHGRRQPDRVSGAASSPILSCSPK